MDHRLHTATPTKVPAIKTATRRKWKKPRAKVGAIHQCKTELFSKDFFAKVTILKCYEEPLGKMKTSDYDKEGGYKKESFVDVWKEINGSYDPEQVVWVVEFELVE